MITHIFRSAFGNAVRKLHRLPMAMISDAPTRGLELIMVQPTLLSSLHLSLLLAIDVAIAYALKANGCPRWTWWPHETSFGRPAKV